MPLATVSPLVNKGGGVVDDNPDAHADAVKETEPAGITDAEADADADAEADADADAEP